MNQDTYLSDGQVRELAKAIIKEIAGNMNISPPLELLEEDECIKLVLKVKDTDAGIFFSPQKRVEAILRETELWVIENLMDVLPPEEFSNFIYRQIWLNVEDEELKFLIGKYYSACKSVISRVEKSISKHEEQARERREAIINKVSANSENIKQLKEFANKVKEVKPLWEYVISYFEENDYSGQCMGVIKEDRFKKLSGNNDVPKELVKDVYKRQADLEPYRNRYEPLAFAIKHAALVIHLKGQFDAVQKKYYEGLKHLEDDSLSNLLGAD